MCSHRYRRLIKYFCTLYLVYNHIWLNLLKDDHHFRLHKKIHLKKHYLGDLSWDLGRPMAVSGPGLIKSVTSFFFSLFTGPVIDRTWNLTPPSFRSFLSTFLFRLPLVGSHFCTLTGLEIWTGTWVTKPAQHVPSQVPSTSDLTWYPDSCRDPCGHLDAQTGPTGSEPVCLWYLGEQVRTRTRVEIHADTWMPKPVQRVPNQSAFTYFGVTSYPDSCRDPCGHLDAQTGPTAVHPKRTIKTWTVESRPHWRERRPRILSAFETRRIRGSRFTIPLSSLSHARA